MILRLLFLFTTVLLTTVWLPGCVSRRPLTTAQVMALSEAEVLYKLTQAMRTKQLDGGRDTSAGRSLELRALSTEYLARTYPQSKHTAQDIEALRLKEGFTWALPIYRGMHFQQLVAALGQPFTLSTSHSSSGPAMNWHYKYFPNASSSTDVYLLNNRVTSWYSYRSR